MKKIKPIKQFRNRFVQCEDGGATIEMLLWIPTLMLVFFLIADVSFIFHGKSQAMRIIQDANRALSVGAIDSTTALQDRVTAQLNDLKYGSVVQATIDSTTGIVTTIVKVPANDMTAIGTIPALKDFDVQIVSSHYLEQ